MLLLKTLLLLCIPKQSTRSTEFRIEYKNNKRRRRRRGREKEKETRAGVAASTGEVNYFSFDFSCTQTCSHLDSFNFVANNTCSWCCSEKDRMSECRQMFSKTGVMRTSKSMCWCEIDGKGEKGRGDGKNVENFRTENIRKRKLGSDSFWGGNCLTRGIKRRVMYRTRSPTSFSLYCYRFLIVLALLGMCQVSEECPAVCECKWKSGKESVICSNAKTKLSEIPSGLDPGTQVSPHKYKIDTEN